MWSGTRRASWDTPGEGRCPKPICRPAARAQSGSRPQSGPAHAGNSPQRLRPEGSSLAMNGRLVPVIPDENAPGVEIALPAVPLMKMLPRYPPQLPMASPPTGGVRNRAVGFSLIRNGYTTPEATGPLKPEVTGKSLDSV